MTVRYFETCAECGRRFLVTIPGEPDASSIHCSHQCEVDAWGGDEDRETCTERLEDARAEFWEDF